MPSWLPDWFYARKAYIGTAVAAVGAAVSFFYVMIQDKAISLEEGNAFVLLVIQAVSLVAVALGIYKPRNAPTPGSDVKAATRL